MISLSHTFFRARYCMWIRLVSSIRMSSPCPSNCSDSADAAEIRCSSSSTSQTASSSPTVTEPHHVGPTVATYSQRGILFFGHETAKTNALVVPTAPSALLPVASRTRSTIVTRASNHTYLSHRFHDRSAAPALSPPRVDDCIQSSCSPVVRTECDAY